MAGMMKGRKYHGDENICMGLSVKARKQYAPSEGMRMPGGMRAHKMSKAMHRKMMKGR